MGTSSDGTPVERKDVDHDSATLTWVPGNPNGAPVSRVEVVAAKIREYRPEDLESATEAATPSKGSAEGSMKLGMSVTGVSAVTGEMSSLAIDGGASGGGLPDTGVGLDNSLSLGHTASSSAMTGMTGMTELTWNDMTTNGVQLGPTTYKVKRLTSGASYIFRIRAKNDCGWSEYSTASELVTTMLVGPPQAPSALEISTYYAVVRWNPALDNQFNFTALELDFETAVLPAPSSKEQELNSGMSTLVWKRMATSKWSPDPLHPPQGEEPTEEEGGAGGYVLVDGLQPNAPYLMRVRVRTVVGWSSWSLTSDVILTPGPA
jgi:hypothetical protein